MKRTIVTLCLVLLAIGVSVFVWWSTNSYRQAAQPLTQTPQSKTTYTLAEVAEHNSRDDCWAVINDTVYDLTSYINRHPGGQEILRACGIDATTLFTSRQTSDGQFVGSGTPHSQAADEQLARLKIGELVKD